MKIKQEHYNTVKEAISKIDKAAVLRHIEAVKQEGKYKDLNTKISWDLLWASKQNDFIRDNIYPYANDEHINTMLKRISNELGYTQ